MKKITLMLTIAAMVMVSSCGNGDKGKKGDKSPKKVEIKVQKESYKPGEKDALIVLKAYADKDLKTLKSYAGSAQTMAMTDDYFKTNSNVNNFRKKISGSTGSFQEIRYSEEKVNFEKYYYVTAVFYESPSGQLSAVKLKSADKEKWMLAGFGTAYLKKSEFGEMSLEIPK
jgi:hypothetical protein